MRRFYPEVESLRGAAALMVAAEHSMSTFVSPDAAVHSWPLMVLNGSAAVILFFVMSGFVLSMALSETKPSALAYFKFIERRFCRIVPAMWLSIVLAVAVYFYMGAPVSISVVAKHFVFADSSINGPLWSLRPEIFYSLVLPLATWLVVSAGPLVLFPMIVLAGWSTSLSILALNNLEFAFPFALGVAVFSIGLRVSDGTGRAGSAIALAAAALLCVSRNLQQLLGLSYGQFVCINAALSFVIVCHCAFGSGVMTKVLGTRFFRYIGRISYSFYVLHFVVLDFINATLFRIFPANNLYSNPTTCQIFDLVVSVPVAIALAALSYRFVELRFMRLTKRNAAEAKAFTLPASSEA